jgi:hypothetical protein
MIQLLYKAAVILNLSINSGRAPSATLRQAQGRLLRQALGLVGLDPKAKGKALKTEAQGFALPAWLNGISAVRDVVECGALHNMTPQFVILRGRCYPRRIP